MTAALAALGFLVGTWHCTYAEGSQLSHYTARFAYDLSENWIQETDSSQGTPLGEAFVTSDPKSGSWTYVVLGSDRTTTVFQGSGIPTHVTYRGVYPKSDFRETFDRNSSTTYTVHFTGTYGGTGTSSTDVCTKQ